MKSIKFFAVASAVALLSTAGFTSCNQKNGPEDPKTGNYNGEVVKTEFLINIAENAAGKPDKYYMPGTTVQTAQTRESFRGMDKIVLIPYAHDDVDERMGANITLSSIASGTSTLHRGNNSTLYENVPIPIGTQNFLFYGKAIDVTAEADITSPYDRFKFGYVNSSNLYDQSTGSVNAITFGMEPIYKLNTTPEVAQNLADFVTRVANVSGVAKAPASHDSWATHENEGIKAMYTEFTTNLKAGSSSAILAVVNDLYNTLETHEENYALLHPDDVETTDVNESYDYVSRAIRAAIEEATTVSGTAKNHTLSWKAASSVEPIVPEYRNYPASIYLPDGAAAISWSTGTNRFDVTSSSKMGSLTTTAIALGGFVYPVSLQYFTQSQIKTAKTSQKEKYKDNTSDDNNWETILDAYTAGNAVTAGTRSVAISTPINYGVGQLAINLKRSYVDLKDNDGNVFDKDQTGTQKLYWKGVLIGDQKAVDYKFEQKTTATAYTIYDCFLDGKSASTVDEAVTNLVEIPANTSSSDNKVSNYTLVFSTPDNENHATSMPVYIAIELKNDLGSAFVGADGVIPNGGTFYLVAALDANALSYDGDNNPNASNHPVKYNVFYKDFVTTANLTIGAESLKHAYYTIPDLRSSNLELGFSVNLSWTKGLTFDVAL